MSYVAVNYKCKKKKSSNFILKVISFTLFYIILLYCSYTDLLNGVCIH